MEIIVMCLSLIDDTSEKNSYQTQSFEVKIILDLVLTNNVLYATIVLKFQQNNNNDNKKK